ncbi:glutathione S-transferase family protein [Leptolyngbya sp. FACHB-711]|uniref:glutathione S-transferase n=2 Tax=Leptolyngbya TaxID=47251 RepID=UPI0016831979|nr:glutathione S-transferase family protein [Leptolyngbya sp. FACHB-711]MBD1852330.1 glutathione S-transferase family protein [Cyanobacteria bacterium FACHB-502]MBD2024865.1 glutathione S-transferase family protein [Leptolyngbya sp. FACHB-711]
MEFTSRLITFRISHYCEKVRWALDRISFPYVEECHLPLLHRLKTTPLGGSSVPVLVTKAEILKDSADILKHLETVAPPHLKLYPDLPVLRQEVQALEAEFNLKLGVLTRQWGYFYALQNQSVMKELWCEGVPTWEKLLFPIMFPLTCRLIHSSYNVHRDSASAAYRQIQRIFERVSDRLSDGRRYLVGDCFSAADLAFASLSAPSVVPPQYGGCFPELNQLPDEMVEQIQILRETIAGKYALRLYEEERCPVQEKLITP